MRNLRGINLLELELVNVEMKLTKLDVLGINGLEWAI